jgi:hypothetical protein
MKKPCEHCGLVHEFTCSLIRAIEYYQDGKVKRIEFHEPKAVSLPSLPLYHGLQPVPKGRIAM